MNNMQGAAEQVGGVVQEIQKRTVSSFFLKKSLFFRETKKSLFSPTNSSSFSLHLFLFSVLLSHPCG